MDNNTVNGGDPMHDLMRFPHRYTKEELLDIKERPFSKRRPSCLLEKYDSDGVWDPEKWHASLYPNSGRTSPVEERPKKDPETSLMRRIVDPRERVKEEDLEVVLSPQRRSFGGGCHVTTPASTAATSATLTSGSRRSGSPLENGRRIGSGRLLSSTAATVNSRAAAAAFEGKEPPHKEKRFRRDYGEGKRSYGERRRHDSYTEEEPEWFSAGPTSQSETIELIGFDDKILEEEQKGRKRSRRRNASLKEGIECNGGLAEEEVGRRQEVAVSEQEVPPTREEFDFNEFFNLDKSVPGLASMIEDVLGEGSVSSVSSSRFSRWFSSNPSRSGSRSSSLRSTPHEELERLAGLSPPGSVGGAFFAPIPVEGLEAGPGHGGGRGLGPGGGASSCPEGQEVDILEMLHKAKVDLRPLLSSLSANKEKLRQSTHSGVVLSVEEVEAGLKGLKMEPEAKAPQNPLGSRRFKDGAGGGGGDMSAFNKLVSSMKASGTLPSQSSKSNQNLDSQLISSPETAKNILQEILGGPGNRPPAPVPAPPTPSSTVLSALMGGLETTTTSSPTPPPPRASSADYLRHRIPSPVGFGPSVQAPLLGDPFQGMRKSISPAAAQLDLPPGAVEGFPFLPDLAAAMTLSGVYQPGLGLGPAAVEKGRDMGFRNRQPGRMAKPPAALGHLPSPASPPASVTSMLSPSFTPTSVIRKMYESKDKGKEENGKSKGHQGDHGGDDNDQAMELEAPPPGVKLSRGSAPSCCSSSSSLRCCPKEAKVLCERKLPPAVSPVPAHFLRQAPPPAPPPPLPPGLVQRMLAQGLPPHHLPPLLQAGLLPPGVDLALLGQPCYPLLSPRPAGPLQLAIMQHQHQLQRSGSGGPPSAMRPAPPLPRGSGGVMGVSSLGGPGGVSSTSSSSSALSRWFGSEVLQQPLPSMPSSKVISVDELEFRP
nr:eukaryotic translation initiation factor 4E transporter isoform X1 [Anolis sagrei ordinatus]